MSRGESEGESAGESGSDGEPAPQRPKRTRELANVSTVAEASEHCEALVQRQVGLAIGRAAPPNVPTEGDAAVKRALYMLLSQQGLRGLFLRTARAHQAWPRLRPLFGSPPYSFLLSEDAALMRATGISGGRTNMTFRRPGASAGYSQFYGGHYVDAFAREYRVSTTDDGNALAFDMRSTGHVLLMSVRVPKRRREERVEMLKDAERRTGALFPRVGDVLELSYAPALQAVWARAGKEESVRVRVQWLVPRGPHSSTAALRAVKV